MQARDETGVRFRRSDDKFTAYFLHNVEDVVEFLDLEDPKLNGQYNGICRYAATALPHQALKQPTP